LTSLLHVLVGVDGSEASTRALDWAIGLVRASGGEIIAIHALGLLTHLDDNSVVPSAQHRSETAARFEQEWCRSLAEASVAYRCLLIDGDPVTSLLRAARDQNADLIVVGARGTGDHPGLLLGSTSLQLVHEADRPVTVVPLHVADRPGAAIS
jgi:nucleotide-binding universal stress UspA family protein